MSIVRAGFAATGSFCTLEKAFAQIPALQADGFELTPILSETAFGTDTRFGPARHFIELLEKATGKTVIHTIPQAEPIGPSAPFDVLFIAPCTGNTLGKLANGITDTAVTMAAKAHLRSGRPLVLAISTNDALRGSAPNLGRLLNVKNIYFVPFRQDDCLHKPASLVADMSLLPDTAKAALRGEQLQPLLR